jgi:hypothetical protein
MPYRVFVPGENPFVRQQQNSPFVIARSSGSCLKNASVVGGVGVGGVNDIGWTSFIGSAARRLSALHSFGSCIVVGAI